MANYLSVSRECTMQLLLQKCCHLPVKIKLFLKVSRPTATRYFLKVSRPNNDLTLLSSHYYETRQQTGSIHIKILHSRTF